MVELIPHPATEEEWIAKAARAYHNMYGVHKPLALDVARALLKAIPDRHPGRTWLNTSPAEAVDDDMDNWEDTLVDPDKEYPEDADVSAVDWDEED